MSTGAIADLDVEANPVGAPLHQDSDGRRFYEAFTTFNSKEYHVKDCVQIDITEEDSDEKEFDFGQITAIFEVQDEEEEAGGADAEPFLMLEIRWFLKPENVRLFKSKKIKSLPNELIESCKMDDIPAGSVMKVIRVCEASEISSPTGPTAHPAKRARRSTSTSMTIPTVSETADEYSIRFMLSEQEDTLLPISLDTMWQRSDTYSDYSQCYNSENSKNKTADKSEDGLQDPFSKAVAQLHISVLPAALPCREEEQKKVFNFLKSAMSEGGRKRPLYISGMPGTGKTATVHAAITALRKEQAESKSSGMEVNSFEFIEINCLRISSPSEAYTVLWRGLSGEFVGPQIALARLKAYFEDVAARTNAPSNAKKSLASVRPTNYIVCLLDELDYLVTKNESIVYNFFDWPQQQNSGLIVVGVANTMDLPERLNKRSLSRLGGQQLLRIAFKAYTHEQINDILADRLQNLAGVFDAKSLQLTARKAASTAGDLRSALKICQRAIELHRDNQLLLMKNQPAVEGKPIVPVTLQMVSRAAAEYKENPMMIATGAACNFDKAIFIGMCRYNKSTGVAEMTVEEIWDRTCDVIHEYGKYAEGGGLDVVPPWVVFDEALARLIQQGMLGVTSGGGTGKQQGASGGFTYSATTMLSPRLLHSDITAALRSTNDPLAAAVWDSNK